MFRLEQKKYFDVIRIGKLWKYKNAARDDLYKQSPSAWKEMTSDFDVKRYKLI